MIEDYEYSVDRQGKAFGALVTVVSFASGFAFGALITAAIMWIG